MNKHLEETSVPVWEASETRRVALALIKSLQHRNRTAIQDLFDPHAILNNATAGELTRGAEAIVSLIWTVADAFPDLDLEIKNLVVENDKAVIEAVRHGTHVGPLFLRGMEIAPTGRTVALPECIVLTIHRGRILKMTVYTDRLTTREQLAL